MRFHGGKLHDKRRTKAGTGGLGFVAQIAAERPHESAREIKPQAGRLRLLLEGPEQ